VRRQLAGDEKPRFAGYASWQAVADYRDEATPNGLFWIVWGPGARFLFYRVSAESVYWEGIFATPEGQGDPPGGRKQAVLDRYAGWTHPVEAIVAATEEHAISRADAYDRKPLKRWGEGDVTLLGDAAHAMLPFAAQGAAMAIEDAAVLADCLSRQPGNATEAFRQYATLRQPRIAQVRRTTWQSGAIYHLPGAVALARNLTMKVLGGRRLLAQRDWLYDWQPA
jgi:2-polyprenyl-6-methoxyphenol hydroxylase-like FAD-dependent oxidoreductase